MDRPKRTCAIHAKRKITACTNYLNTGKLMEPVSYDNSAHFHWCNIATIGDGLLVASSHHPCVEGLGVFASRAFKKGDIVTEYVGTYVDAQDVCDTYYSTYILPVSTRYMIDASINCKSIVMNAHAGGFVNDVTGVKDGQGNQLEPNVRYAITNKPVRHVQQHNEWKLGHKKPTQRAWILCTHNIEPGEELLTSYGVESYWNNYSY